MNKMIWIVVGIAIGFAAFYLYNENKPTEMERSINEAGREIERTGESLGDFIDDTAQNINREMNK